jgi:probable HAF family extracellular repeat protein
MSLLKERAMAPLLQRNLVPALAVTLTALLGTASTNAQAVASVSKYRVTDLGTLGGTFSSPLDINIHGAVAGVSVAPDDVLRGFIWERGVMTDLGSLGGPQAAGASINALGQVGGWSDLDTPARPSIFNQTSLFCNPPASGEPAVLCHATRWQHGRLTDLGTLGGENSTVGNKGINDQGQVVGTAETTAVDPTGTDGSLKFHAFLWDRGKMRDLGTLGNAPDSLAVGINERGQVIGLSLVNGSTFDGRNGYGFIWQDGKMAALGTLGGSYSSPTAINNRGWIVGRSSLPGDVIGHAALWRHGHATDLGTLPGDVSSEATDITDRGQIVGDSCSSAGDCRAVLWAHGKAIDINTLISKSSGWQLTDAQAENARGQIAGNGLHDGQPHAYLLTRE